MHPRFAAPRGEATAPVPASQDDPGNPLAPGADDATGTGQPDATGTAGAEQAEPTGALRFVLLFKDLLKPRNVLLAAGALVAGILALTGGLSQIEGVAQEVPTAAPGATVTAAPLDVVVKRAFWAEGPDDPIAKEAPGLGRLLIVIEVTDRSPRPVDLLTLQDSFRIDADGLRFYGQPQASERATPMIYRGADLLPARPAQSDLTTPLVLSWDQDATQPVPTSLTLLVRGHTWRASSLDGGLDWFDPTDVARISVPLQRWRS